MTRNPTTPKATLTIRVLRRSVVLALSALIGAACGGREDVRDASSNGPSAGSAGMDGYSASTDGSGGQTREHRSSIEEMALQCPDLFETAIISLDEICAHQPVAIKTDGSTHSCEFPLDVAPNDVSRLYVAVDCEAVPQRSGAQSNWNYYQEAMAVVLQGESCNRVRNGEGLRVDILEGCQCYCIQ